MRYSLFNAGNEEEMINWNKLPGPRSRPVGRLTSGLTLSPMQSEDAERYVLVIKHSKTYNDIRYKFSKYVN